MGLSKKVWHSDIDLNKYELLQARLENLASAPGTPGLGQVYYDTVLNNFFGKDDVGFKQLDAVLLADSATDVTATAAEVNILDLSATSLTIGWVYGADGASAASWRQLLGSEISNDSAWISDITAETLSDLSDIPAEPTGGAVEYYLKYNDTGDVFTWIDITTLAGDPDQTLANTSDATTHTVTLSASGGSVQLVEGTNITLTTTGTGLDGIVTIASSAGGGDMILASAQTNTGIKTFLDTTMKLRNVANTFDGYFVNTNTVDRIYTLQDAAGTLAFVTRSVVNITGTKAEFDTAVTDGDFMYIGDAPTSHTLLGHTISGETLGHVLVADSATTYSIRQLLGSEINNDSSWTSNAGDMVLATIQTVTAAKTFNDNTLLLDDSDSVFDLILRSASTITVSDKSLTIDVNDVSRILTFTADATIGGTNTGDQTVITAISDTRANFDTALSDGNFVFEEDTSTSGWSFVIDDDTMGTASATNLASAESIKAYVDSAVLGGMVYKGAEDATTAPPTGTGILTGWTYTVTVAGNGGGFWTTALEIGDVIISEQINPTVEAHWTVVNKDLPGGVTLKYSTTVGNGALTDIPVTHNLSTKDVQVVVYRTTTPWDTIECQVERNTTAQVTLGFNTAPTSAEFTCVVIG